MDIEELLRKRIRELQARNNTLMRAVEALESRYVVKERDRYRTALEQIRDRTLPDTVVGDIARETLKGEGG